MKAEDIEALRDIFKVPQDVISETDVCDFFDVIAGAVAVHVDRERIRQGLWKDYPSEDQFNQIKVKVDRVLRSLERLKFIPTITGEQRIERQALIENIVSESHDIINYANFGVRKLPGE